MKYKVGDKVRIKSFDELKRKIENGLKFKSKKFYTNLNEESIFCLSKHEIDKIQNKELEIIKIFDDNTLFFKNVMGQFPFEFIKEKKLNLPNYLFKI